MAKGRTAETVSSEYLKDLMDEAYEIEFQYKPENDSAYWTHPPSETDRELIKQIITDMDESVQPTRNTGGLLQSILELFQYSSEDKAGFFEKKWDIDLREDKTEYNMESFYQLEASADYEEGKNLNTDWGRISNTIIRRTLEEEGEAIIKAKLNENPLE